MLHNITVHRMYGNNTTEPIIKKEKIGVRITNSEYHNKYMEVYDCNEEMLFTVTNINFNYMSTTKMLLVVNFIGVLKQWENEYGLAVNVTIVRTEMDLLGE